MSLSDKLISPSVSVAERFKEPLEQLMNMGNVKDIDTLFDAKEMDTNGAYATIFTVGGGEYIMRLDKTDDVHRKHISQASKLVNHDAKHLAKVYFYGEFKKYHTSIVIMEKLDENKDTRIVEDIQTILNETYRINDKFDYTFETIAKMNNEKVIKEALDYLIDYTKKSRIDTWGWRSHFEAVDSQLSSKDLDVIQQLFVALLEFKTLTGTKYLDFHSNNVMVKGSTYKLIDL